jgi:hypothetical protein
LLSVPPLTSSPAIIRLFSIPIILSFLQYYCYYYYYSAKDGTQDFTHAIQTMSSFESVLFYAAEEISALSKFFHTPIIHSFLFMYSTWRTFCVSFKGRNG